MTPRLSDEQPTHTFDRHDIEDESNCDEIDWSADPFDIVAQLEEQLGHPINH